MRTKNYYGMKRNVFSRFTSTMHVCHLLIIYLIHTFRRPVAESLPITIKEILGLAVTPGMCSMIKINPTLGSIDQFVAPWINDSSLCRTNQNVTVATTSLHSGQVLVMQNDCQSHIIDFHEFLVTEIKLPPKYNTTRKCFTTLGLRTYMSHTVGDYTLMRLHRNNWEWLMLFGDQRLFCAVYPETDFIEPQPTSSIKKEHKLFFDLENRIFYKCAANNCSIGENADFFTADVHSSIPSNVQVFEFGDTTYTIYHSHNDNGKPVVNVRDIRNSSNAFAEPFPGGLHFKLFAVNISKKYTKEAFHCFPNCSSNRTLDDMTGSKESKYDAILFVLLITLIISSCIVVALLITVYIQRSQLSKIKNSKACSCNSTTHEAQLQRSPSAITKELKTTMLPMTNDIRDSFNDSSSESMEAPHEESHKRSAALVNASPINPNSTSMKSCSDITQSLSSADLSPDSSTVKSIGQHLKKWNDLKIPPARPHPETAKVQSISTMIPTGPQECMNPRGEKTTSKDHNQPTLGHWPIQFMRRVLRAKRRSKTSEI